MEYDVIKIREETGFGLQEIKRHIDYISLELAINQEFPFPSNKGLIFRKMVGNIFTNINPKLIMCIKKNIRLEN